MKDVEVVAAVLRVEAHMSLCRAAMLDKNDALFLEELLKARSILGTMCANLLSTDETRIYIAR